MPRVKIPHERYDEVFAFWQKELPMSEIAKQFGVTASTIGYVLKKRRERIERDWRERILREAEKRPVPRSGDP